MEQEHTQDSHEHTFEPQKKENLIPFSIIAAAVLISASIFYNTKQIVDSQSSLKMAVGSAQNQQAGAQPAGAAGKPIVPVDLVVRKDAPFLGKKDAKVTVVEFADFQCPFCQKHVNGAFAQIKSQYINSGKVKYIYMHFPLAFHAKAQIAGMASECANRQGKFWPFHDKLFIAGTADGTGLAEADLKKYAGELGLNISEFNSCLDSKQTEAIVNSDQQAGQASGVSGTPSFFINGKILVGAQPFSAFEQMIEAALK